MLGSYFLVEIEAASVCVDKMVKGLRGFENLKPNICVTARCHMLNWPPLFDRSFQFTILHIVTGPIGAQLKLEELTRLGGSDRERKKCPAIMELTVE